MWNDTLTIIASVLGGILAIIIYLIPTYIAFRKDHPNKIGIMLINIFLGWSLIGYIASLIWAISGGKEKSSIAMGK